MPAYTLSHVTDAQLLVDLSALVGTDRKTTAALLAHLAEVDARELFRPAACSSMFGYCTGVLHLSDDAAFKRIRAARFARRFPQLFEAIADGRLHLSGVVLLGPHLTDDNIDDVIAAATHRTKSDLEILVARLAPRPDLPAALLPVPPTDAATQPQLVPEPPVQPAEPPPVTRTRPLSPDRFGLQVTITQATRDKLERAQALLRHANASGDLAEVLDRALDALLVSLEKKKFGATSRPRTKKPRPETADPSYVTNDIRRAAHARDGEQCAFVSESGVRCTERGFLELDHVTPRCLGGETTADQIRILCRVHNQYEAERLLGADFMRGKRAEARARRRGARPTRNDKARSMHGGTAQPIPGETVQPMPGGSREARAISAPAPLDADVTLALRGMGFAAAETRRAMADSAQVSATTFEARLRAALAALMSARGSRCSDGPFDQAARRLQTFVSGTFALGGMSWRCDES